MPALKWGTQFTVNTTLAGVQNDASISILTDGDLIAVWIDASGASPVMRTQRLNADGTPQGTETIVGVASNQAQPDVAALSDGGYVIVSRQPGTLSGDTSDIAVTRVLANGTVQTSVIQSAGLQIMPEVTALANGGFAVVYESGTFNAAGTNYDIKMRLYTASGANLSEISVGNGGVVNFGDNHPTVTQLSGGNIVVCWNGSSGQTNYRVFNASGSPLGAEVTVDTNAGMDVGVIPHGAGFVMAWRGNIDAGETRIIGRAYDASGTPTAPQFNIGGGNLANGPEIVSLKDGRIMSAWIEGGGVFGRIVDPMTGLAETMFRIDTSGTAVFNETTLNNNLSLQVMQDGRVAVSWQNTATTDIAMQFIDPRNGAVSGTAGADQMFGNDTLNDTMTGGQGNDTIYGLGGNDSMQGELGDDAISGGAGNDTVDGGGGADTMDGGEGVDTMIVTSGSGGYLWDMVTGATNAGDTAVNFENATTGGGDDTITGTAGDNIINTNGGNDAVFGGAGKDTINGGAGNDTINPGEGIDSVDGGDGIDLLDLSTDTEGVLLEMSNGYTGNGERFLNFENIAAGSGVDQITGAGGANLILLGDGDDAASGNGGNDTVYGQNGADNINGNEGADFLNGGSGNDTIDGGDDADTIEGGEGSDQLSGGNGNDVIYAHYLSTPNGSTDGDTLNGNGGDDLLVGSAGNDTFIDLGGVNVMNGGAGDDVFLFSNAENAMDGGDGIDTLDYSASTSSVNWNMATGVVINFPQTAVNIENYIGGSGNDTITGNASANAITTNGGDDRLNGGAGADILTGGAGADSFILARADLAAGANDVIADFNGADGDRMVVLGGTVYDIDLTGSGLYRSLSVGGALNTVVHFGGIVSVDVLNSVGKSMAGGGQVFFDADNSQYWTRIVDAYSLSDKLAQRTFVFDDNSFFATTYDVDNTQPFSVQQSNFSAAGELLSQSGTRDDGATYVKTYANQALVTETVTDEGNYNPWREFTTAYKPDGAADSQFGHYDDNRTWAIDYDDQGNLPYAWLRNEFDAAGALTEQRVLSDDGTLAVTSYDVSNSQNYVVQQTNFDANGALRSQHGVSDNGNAFNRVYVNQILATEQITDYDQNETWREITTTFKTDGQKDGEIGYYDDNRFWAVDYDDAGNQPYITLRNEFSATGALALQTIDRDDHYSLRTSYNASQQATSLVVDDYANQVDWRWYQDTYGSFAGGSTTQRYTQYDDGHGSYLYF